jgi:hypothetical protein
VKKLSLLALLILASSVGFAQQSNPALTQSTAQRIISSNSGTPITLGGYAEIKYNQPDGKNGTLDAHRVIAFIAYRFDDKLQFVSEIEFEHAAVLEVEQAFVNYNLSNAFNLRAGLMLVPFGITNLYHEPTTYNGVNRPYVNKYIVPTTWREVGVGFAGTDYATSLSYEAYLFNGIRSLDSEGNGVIGGKSGIRSGRQSAEKAKMDSPSLAVKIDYFGINGLRTAVSGFFGRSVADDDYMDVTGATVGISMIGGDYRYVNGRFTSRGEFVYASLSDTEAYNQLTGKNLGSAFSGGYVEAAYNLFSVEKKQKLDAFVRYQEYDTHAKTAGNLTQNDAYDRNDITFGLSFHPTPGVVFKGDYQLLGDRANNDLGNQINFGVGVWF